MKKLLAILCAAMLSVACCIPVFAAGEGSITIENAIKDQTYSVYGLAEAVELDLGGGTNTYYSIADAKWETFFNAQSAYFTLQNVNVGGTDYTLLLPIAAMSDAQKATLAKDAVAHAETNGITATQTATASADGTLTFSGLTLGYYAIDSSLGTVCALTTTNSAFTMVEKNVAPTLDKEAEEDSTGAFGDSNTVDIGDTVNFKVTITAQEGAANYKMHDTMSAGLSFDGIDSVSITLNGVAVAAENYTLTAPGACGCTFEAEFNSAFTDTLKKDDQIVVTYSATLNENANVGTAGNTNSAELDYGDGTTVSTTPATSTTTYTYGFDLVKTDEFKALLPGAEFELYRGNETTPVALVNLGNGVYRVATSGDTSAVTTIAVANGKVTIQGLDSDSYFLKETKAPEGYNLLDATQNFAIENANLDATVNSNHYVGGGVQVINKTGTVLPETGGFGTTMFILIGGGLALCTGILLVTKKRMDKIAD